LFTSATVNAGSALGAGSLATSAFVATHFAAAAAVLLGGTSFVGGVGGVTGTAVGVLFIGVLQNGLSISGVQSFWQEVVTGGILIAAVAFDRLQQNRSGRLRGRSGRGPTAEAEPALDES
jgi:ribose/xylose/arabinose/galactoside ABC-type transport system permease subunit